MDISAFSEDTFDAKSWINEIFQNAEAKENKEVFANNLVLKIQSYIKQVNADLEDTSREILTNLPHVIKDTKLLQLEAVTLKDKMSTINHDIEKVHSESGQCMAGLERLDRLKTQLESAKQSLLEADKWSSLISDIEELFELGDVNSISERLLSMSRSLDTMGRHVESSDKIAQLEELRNRLEALASPLIVQGFSTGCVDQSKRMVSIFTAMDRLPQLLSYYKTYHKTNLAQKWREIVETNNYSNIVWLQDFYDCILQHCKEQVKWTTAILLPQSDISTQVVSNSISELFPTLDPSLNSILQKTMKHSSDKLTLLSDAVGCTKKFAVNISNVVNCNGPLSHDTQLSLAKSIFAYLIPSVTQYPNLESTNLSVILNNLQDQERTRSQDPTDTIRDLSLANAKVMQSAELAINRCDNITQGCGYPGLARILEAYFISHCDRYSSTVRHLEERSQFQEQLQDWNRFQTSISLLQTLGELYEQIRKIDNKITQQAIDTNSRLKSQSDVFRQYKLLFLSNREECKAFDNFIENLSVSDCLFESFYGKLRLVCTETYKVLFDDLCAPILVQIGQVADAPAWCRDGAEIVLALDLPEYSFSPQEYITQIGQYLMTLPQHLEPYLLQPSENLLEALKLANSEYDNENNNEKSLNFTTTDVLLSLVCKTTCTAYSESLLQKICKLDENACKQLAVDIEYLGSVLEELGLSSKTLGELNSWPPLLRCSPEKYQNLSGINPKLVTAVRQMRGIASTLIDLES